MVADMKKKSLYKDIRREILHSKGRFFSILILIMLGVSTFVGLKAVGPAMLITANDYFRTYQLADVEVQSTYGLDETDVKILNRLSNIKNLEFGYTADVILKDSNLVMKIFSTPGKEQKTNQYLIKKGRMPEKSGEIVVDDILAGDPYQIGDKITFVQNDGSEFTDTFRTSTYKIVGFVSSSKFIDKTNRGSSTISSGSIDAFAVIMESDFDMEVYTVASIVYNNTGHKDAYSKNYRNLIDQHVANVENAIKSQPKARLSKIKKESKDEIYTAEQEWKEGRKQLANQEKHLKQAREQLDNAKKQLENGEKRLTEEYAAAYARLQANEKKLNDSRIKLDDAEIKLSDAKESIADGKIGMEKGEQQLAKKQTELDEQRKALEQAGLLIGEALQKIHAAQEALNNEKEKLSEEKARLLAKEKMIHSKEMELIRQEKVYQQAKVKLAHGKIQYQKSKSKSLAIFKKQRDLLKEGESEYKKNITLFNQEKPKAERKLTKAKEEINEAKEKIEKMKLPKYYVLDRTYNNGFSEFKDNANRVTSLSTIFPVLFFLVAVLVCLTTMTRMVDEGRTQIGLLKALGYSNGDSIAKYLIYGTLACVIGSLVGIILGFEFFTRLVFNAYRGLYNIPDLIISYDPKLMLLSVGVAFLCTTVAVYAAARPKFSMNAAELMRPEAPKNGKKILLERFSFIWKHLNFTSKVTARNLFRYKKRMIMTIFGVMGCTALMFTGFGLRDSINDIVPIQYKEIFKYDALVARDKEMTESAYQKYKEILDDKHVVSNLSIYHESLTALKKGENNQTVNLFIPKETKDWDSYITLRTREQHQRLELSDKGAIITERLARLFDVDIGDKIKMKNEDGEAALIEISGITELYAGHFIYMTSNYYQATFHENADSNAELLILKDSNEKWKDQFAERLMKTNSVLGVSFMDVSSRVMDETMNSLNLVVIVIIGCAAILAFVVLYNLVNINVSERIRELSTIKVLGFYPFEITMYVYRENILLTLLGMVFGFIGGIYLHRIVIATVEMDELMMSLNIHWTSYLFSGILTLFFSLLVMLVMHVKLRRIDMVEALKSVE